MTSPFAGNILITGGSGFLGRGILRYIEREGISSRVTVYSRDEHKQYALRAQFPWVRTILGDVRDTDRLRAVMTGHDVVIHAAAIKHIPEAERDVTEAIGVNVDGSRSVAWAAMMAGVRQVVGVSTDKACSPRNAYGATKMLMERTFQESARLSTHKVRFTNVRYGNVISSTGSVVPLFLDQIAKNNEVSITSEKMTRFWFPVDDAVRLIERALSDDTRHGYTYVARCPAMTVLQVAHAVWLHAGRTDPLNYRITGTRPGEKLHEALIDAYEAPYTMLDSDPHYCLIPPATSMAGEGDSYVMPYDSSSPDRWMGSDEFVELIKDASLV